MNRIVSPLYILCIPDVQGISTRVEGKLIMRGALAQGQEVGPMILTVVDSAE
jgi:hypothetical protein